MKEPLIGGILPSWREVECQNLINLIKYTFGVRVVCLQLANYFYMCARLWGSVLQEAQHLIG